MGKATCMLNDVEMKEALQVAKPQMSRTLAGVIYNADWVRPGPEED